MRNILAEQFEAFRGLILKNLMTIKDLIVQADKLSALMQQETDEAAKKTLEEIKKTLDIKINDLIKTNEQLFDTYMKAFK